MRIDQRNRRSCRSLPLKSENRRGLIRKRFFPQELPPGDGPTVRSSNGCFSVRDSGDLTTGESKKSGDLQNAIYRAMRCFFFFFLLQGRKEGESGSDRWTNAELREEFENAE